MVWMKYIFWLAIAGCLYSYIVYPAILVALLPIRVRKVIASTLESASKLCVIIAAYNEESHIREKLENTLELDRQGLDLEIIVVSDGSSDGTHDAVHEYHHRGVKLMVMPNRQGKEAALLAAIQATDCEILVFTDVSTMIDASALHHIARNFDDPAVGAVSSTDRLVSKSGEVVAEGLYVRYEMWLRHLETKVHTLVGLSGSFFAARRSVCKEWDIDVPSDFGIAINCARAGLYAVSDSQLIGVYHDIHDPRREHHRKLRTMIRGMTGLKQRPEVLNPFRFGLFAFQVWSHKVMRWAVPWFMLLAFFSNLWLLKEGLAYVASMLAQVIFYAVAALPRIWGTTGEVPLVRLANFFVESNFAAARAFIEVLRGRTVVVWQPSQR